MFPNFFSGESGSLTSLFFLVMGGILHLCAADDIRQFKRDFGSNMHTMSTRGRLENSVVAIIIYAFVSLVVLSSATKDPTVFGFVVWWYGALVAWRVGEAITLKIIRVRYKILDAQDQLSQGHFNPPPPAPPPQAVQISYMDEPPARHSQKWRAVSDERHNRQWGRAQITGAAQQDDDAFAFDPDRFKR